MDSGHAFFFIWGVFLGVPIGTLLGYAMAVL